MPSTVLIVDDERNIRRTVRMVLEGEGYGVEEAASAEEAVARLEDIGADVVLLDVQLPGMSGLDALGRLLGRESPDPDLTVVMISGHATLADAVRAVKGGAYDFLEKPLDRERLILTLRNALERRIMAREVKGLPGTASRPRLSRCRRRPWRCHCAIFATTWSARTSTRSSTTTAGTSPGRRRSLVSSAPTCTKRCARWG